jgi:hypothetical protein
MGRNKSAPFPGEGYRFRRQGRCQGNQQRSLLNKKILMPQQDLFVGLGNLAYAVAKIHGNLHEEEVRVFTDLLQHQTNGDIALFILWLKAKLTVKFSESNSN